MAFDNTKLALALEASREAFMQAQAAGRQLDGLVEHERQEWTIQQELALTSARREVYAAAKMLETAKQRVHDVYQERTQIG